MRPEPKAQEEYIIDRSKVLDIIKILENQGRQFEKTPASYAHNGEEDLRNILLVNLNAVFEGKATGETFQHKGKTDIYLNIDRGNILVFECKFWGGEKVLHETIDQLLSYLTWRHNYGIIIFFAKNKNLTQILNAVGASIEKHPTYRSGLQRMNNSHFISQHKFPADEGKFVEIHSLFYNLYVDKLN